MTQDEKRIKIAMACGWEPSKTDGCWNNAKRRETMENIPDYFHDLNAMHEAEKSLLLKKQMLYQGMIGKVTGNKCPALFGQIHATAAQRAEAFGKTLNLW